MRQLKIQKSITNRSSEALDKYLVEIGRAPLISIEEEIELAQKIKKGGPEAEKAKDRLVTANLRFVVSVAKQYQHQGYNNRGHAHGGPGIDTGKIDHGLIPCAKEHVGLGHYLVYRLVAGKTEVETYVGIARREQRGALIADNGTRKVVSTVVGVT